MVSPKRSLCSLAALSLTASLCATALPGTSLASDPVEWQGSTAIVVTSPESGQISVSAPVAFSVALRADGGILEGAAVQLRNYSTTPVAVANVRVEERNGARVVPASVAASSDETDLLHARFAPPGSEGVDASECLGGGSAPADVERWSADPGKALDIEMTGGFKNPSTTFRSTYANADPVAACVVVWTVEAL